MKSPDITARSIQDTDASTLYTQEDNAVSNIKEDIRGKVKVSRLQNFSFVEIIRYFVFTAWFFGLIYMQLNVLGSFNITSGLGQAVIEKKHRYGIDFYEVYNVTHIVEYLSYGFAREILVDVDYMGNLKSPEDGFRVAYFNKVITGLRLNQDRVEYIDNPSLRFDDFVPVVWTKVDENYDNNYDQSSDDYGPFEIFKFEGGELVMIINRTDPTYLRNINGMMFNRRWLDAYSKNLRFDFWLYNGNYQIFAYVVGQFDILPSGFVIESYIIETLRLNLYETDMDYVRLVLEVIYFVLVMFYTAVEIIQVQQIIRGQIIKDNDQDENHIQKAANFTRNKCRQIGKGMYVYFSDVWNIIDTVQLVISYILIIVWLTYNLDPFLLEFIEDPEDSTNDDILKGISDIQNVYRLYRRLVALNAMFISIRFLKYAGKMKRVAVIFDSLFFAKNEILSFFLLLFAILFSFSIFAYISYGRVFTEFNTINESLISCLEILFWEFRMLKPMYLQNFAAGAIFAYGFTSLMLIILGNMFIAIIGTSYDQVTKQLEEQRDTSKKAKTHWVHKFRTFFVQQCHKCRAIVSKDERIIEQYRKENKYLEKMYEDQKVTDFKGNMETPEYSEYKKKKYQTNSEFMTTKQIKRTKFLEKVMSGNSILTAFVMSAFAILFILTNRWQLEVNQRYQNFESLDQNIKHQVYSLDPDQNLEKVDSFEEFFKWMQTAFVVQIVTDIEGTHVDRNTQYIQSENYLVGQEIAQGPFRMTFRRIEDIDNATNFDIYEKKVRKDPFAQPFFSNKNEETSSFVGKYSGNKYEYEENGGYNSLGGYVMYFSSDFELFQQQVEDLRQDQVMDRRTVSVVFDYVTYNGNQNIVTLASLIFYFQPGGDTLVIPQFRPIRGSLYETPFDYFRACCEIIIIFCLFLLAVINGTNLYNENLKYDNWWHQVKDTLTDEQVAERRRVCPESIRKLSEIFDIYLALDILFFALNISQLISWIMMLIEGRIELKVSDIDYFEKINSYVMHMENYQAVSSVCSVVVFFKLLKYLNLNQAMRLLQDTLKHASKEIFYYLIVLMILLMGFTLFSYAAFGNNALRFSTIPLGAMTLLEMFIGVFDYSELKKGDPLLAPFFFIVYMMLFTFILAYIFIALLERAYKTVKERSLSSEDNDIHWLSSIIVWFKHRCRKNIKEAKSNIQPPDLNVPFTNEPFPYPMQPDKWGRDRAEEIGNERYRREKYFKFIKDVLKNLGAEGSRKRNKTEKYMINETWKSYWFYLNKILLEIQRTRFTYYKETNQFIRNAYTLRRMNKEDDERMRIQFLKIKNIEVTNVGIEEEIHQLKTLIEMHEKYRQYGLKVDPKTLDY